MKLDDRKKLEKFAWEQLEATADDEEQWSFAWAREGCVGDITYRPWWLTEELEFDGDLRDLDLPWSKERLESIERNESDPNARATWFGYKTNRSPNSRRVPLK